MDRYAQANSTDLDQTAPRGNSIIWIYTVCHSVRIVWMHLSFKLICSSFRRIKAEVCMSKRLRTVSVDKGSEKGAADYHLSLVMRKPAFCICENKDADQLRSNCAPDQRLCFRYTDTTLIRKFKPLTIFCGCTPMFVSDLVGNPEKPSSHNEAHFCNI